MEESRQPSQRERELVKYDITTDRVLTIPNLISFARLAGVPLFMWLLLVPEADGWALVVLALSAFSDWLDGHLARRWNQISRIGQLLDPVADRLYIVATLVAFVIRDIVPIWFALAIILRDVLIALALPFLKRSGITALPVHFLGKAATANLLYALPLLLLGDGDLAIAPVALVLGWAFAIWGAVLYWYAGFLYLDQARRILAERG